MKKLFVLAVAATLVTGVTYAGGDKKCCKKDGAKKEQCGTKKCCKTEKKATKA